MFKIITLALLLLFSIASNLQAAPRAELWQRWTVHDTASSVDIDHHLWSELLRKYIKPGDDTVNRFAYGSVSKTDKNKLNRYIDQLSKTPVGQHNRGVQRAYWINLYNALTIQEVLSHFPVDSIRDIRSGIFSTGPWNKKLVKVEGEKLTLNDIEHRILRPIWQDPRIHYAVNCASLGCPNLQREVFTAANTESLLDKAAREFINHPRAAAVIDGKLQVSSIYEWFKADFGGKDAAVIEHLKQYAGSQLATRLGGVSKIHSDHYDWRINSVRHPE